VDDGVTEGVGVGDPVLVGEGVGVGVGDVVAAGVLVGVCVGVLVGVGVDVLVGVGVGVGVAQGPRLITGAGGTPYGAVCHPVNGILVLSFVTL